MFTACGQPGGSEDGVKFPTKALTLVCNYGAGGGGGTDLASRALASEMEKSLGVPVSVINKDGGSATIGITEIFNAKPDGYTFWVASYAPMVIAPNQISVTYGVDDFDYLGTLAQYDYGVLVKADSPYQNIDDLVAAAAAKKGGINIMGAGYPHPVVVNKLAELTGKDIQFVNMNSSAEVVTGLLGNHCDAISLIMSDAYTYIDSGELRLIASSGEERYEGFPDVPTIIEQGYDVSVRSYMGFAVPKGVDPEVLAILQEAFDKAFESETFQASAEKLNIHVNKLSGEEFKEVLLTDEVFWKEFFSNNQA